MSAYIDRDAAPIREAVKTVLDDYAENLTDEEEVEFRANASNWIDLLAEAVIAGTCLT